MTADAPGGGLVAMRGAGAPPLTAPPTLVRLGEPVVERDETFWHCIQKWVQTIALGGVMGEKIYIFEIP